MKDPAETVVPGRPIVLTVGHSTGSLSDLLTLLGRHSITMLVDIRARPHNAFLPQFNRDRMKMDLLEAGVVYVYLGDLLGRLQDGTPFSDRNSVDFLEVESSEPFQRGIAWLAEEAKNHRLCLLCGEAFPESCHRDFLVARNLLVRGVRVLHILPTGRLEEAPPDLFHRPPSDDHGNNPTG